MLHAVSGLIVIGLIGSLSFLFPAQKVVYKTSSGVITFVSEAPLETIKASSKELKGVVDTAKNTFAFSVAVNTFRGFNSPLQQEHFYENYLESTAFPTATFTGKVIEYVNYTKSGIYEIRAKGILNVHGVKTERIIRSIMEIDKEEIIVRSAFIINLEEHNIKIPRIVFQKIAPDISIEIEAVLKPYQIL